MRPHNVPGAGPRLNRASILLWCVAGCSTPGSHSAFQSAGGTSGSAEDTALSEPDGVETTQGDGAGTGSGEDPDSGTHSDTEALKLDVGAADSDTPGDGGGGGSCPCDAAADAIYVLSDDSELWIFHPETNDFELVAALTCEQQNGFSGTTFSLGISRDATAWVQYGGGTMYTVDLSNPSDCAKSSYEPGSFGSFGMSFVSQSASNPCDRIYAHNFAFLGAGKLANIDPDTLQRVPISDDTGHSLVELSGTGDGRLFGLVGSIEGAPPFLAEFDKQTGVTQKSIAIDAFSPGSAFAVTFYGGDFYFFNGQLGSSSEVWHMDYDNSDGPGQGLSQLVQTAPISIVGAGTSTCVPFAPEG